MKIKVMMAATLALLCSATTICAQETLHKVSNVEVLNLDGNPTKLPYWGEKNLLIFYVDPDRHKQNQDFTEELEVNHRASGQNLFCFGVINLKDAPLMPNGIVRSVARKRTATNHGTVLADQQYTLRDAWKLGDCNNQFVLLLVSKEGNLVFMRKGVLTAQDKADFYATVAKYR
ncbi:MAG: YtfJ family protein [Alistipes sp.]